MPHPQLPAEVLPPSQQPFALEVTPFFQSCGLAHASSQTPATSLTGSTLDLEDPSPVYTGDCHFVSAIILGQGATILWQAAVTLLSIVLLCDWLMTIS